ncbi:MAG: hypothetical protein CMN32_02650 [Saprospirales bacterium]|nr:hypothetical protein [Saprospirales bacterium]
MGSKNYKPTIMNLAEVLAKRCDKPTCLAIRDWIGNDADRFSELVGIMLSGDKVLSSYAAWAFSHVVEERPWLINPHLETLIANLDEPGNTDSVIRSTVKALANVDLPEQVQGLALQKCFDLLMDPAVPVAIRVHAMQTVFNISKNEPDLLRELKAVLEEGMETGSAGYRARGKRLLKEITAILKG